MNNTPIALMLIAFCAFLYMCGPNKSSDSKEVKKTNDTSTAVDDYKPLEVISRPKLVEKQFSWIDGSHPGLTNLVKNNMHDPDSYKHISTKFRDDGDRIYVVMQFRGKNGFGGMVRQKVIAYVDFKNNVLEIVK